MKDVKPADIVLVVDDSPDSLGMINDTLETAGYDVLVALEGKQALTIAGRIRPDMILMDAIMPHMDGFDTCRALRDNPELASIPVIFMTGLTDSQSIVKGLEAGGVDYLTKPINPDELLARMNVHMNNARRTSSAYNALDSTGQYLFSTDLSGRVLWATPQTLALFAHHKFSEAWQQTGMAEQIAQWLESEHPEADPAYRLLNLTHGSATLTDIEAEKGLAVNHVQRLHDNEVLLRLTLTSTAAPETILQEKLAITRRESQVLFWISSGKTNGEIAEILEIKPRTVNKHLEQLFPKLGVENRTAAARIAITVINET